MCRRDHILEDGKWCDGNPVSLFLSIWPQIPPSTLIWPEPGPATRGQTLRSTHGVSSSELEQILQIIICLLFSHRVKTLDPHQSCKDVSFLKTKMLEFGPNLRYTFSMNAPGIHSSLIDSHLNISTKHVGFYDMSIKQFTDLFLDKSCTLQTWKIVK